MKSAEVPGANELFAASALMSSRWSRDNLITSHPARLYNGAVLQRVDLASLEFLVRAFEQRSGATAVGAARMGVHTWDVGFRDASGPFMLQIPLAIDEPGRRARAKRDVPRQNFDNMKLFRARGLTRFVMEPRELLILDGDVPAATFTAPAGHYPVTFARGSLQLELSRGDRCWYVPLGPAATAELLAELVAALVYHYDPESEGGTAVTDVCVNDGDFSVRRRLDGTFSVRLHAVRRREGGIAPSLLLLCLIQMMTYEDWCIEDDLVGLPVLIGNPSVAFKGLMRGLRYRHQDLRRSEADAEALGRLWLERFADSSEGRAYRPWVERFLAGDLPPRFGSDPREHWWRLVPLQTKLGLCQLRAKVAADSTATSTARAVSRLLERLSHEVGRSSVAELNLARVNDLDRAEVLALLGEAGLPLEARQGAADEFFRQWPYRTREQLFAALPLAGGLKRLKNRLAFGTVISDADHGTVRSLEATPPEGRAPRALANHELFSVLSLPDALERLACERFPSFESYMDSALHDGRFGYYSSHVQIGETGHFDTHPESLSPAYGRWLSSWLFSAWRDLIARGELSDADPFPVVEFGAGTGRLARDILDALAAGARSGAGSGFDSFAARLEYRIYERSAFLRDRQHRLVGASAIVAPGDARHPASTLLRDFPRGFKGVVVSNEVPDAFGVHKVVLTADGRAFAALSVPRARVALVDALDVEWSQPVRDRDSTLRRDFGLAGNPGDLYLDSDSYEVLMRAVAARPAEAREALLAGLWFEEAYVRASRFPDLGVHLAENADEYAKALAAESSAVVLYVNLNADRFIRELGATLDAGLVITIDYGDTIWGLVQGARQGGFPFRVYGEWKEYVPRPNDPYAAPGLQDMTADVNFTAMARAGEASGLEVVHFGPERDLTGEHLPHALAIAEENDVYARFLGNPVFKVLVQGKRTSLGFDSRFSSRLPLVSREGDVPKARRDRIAAIRRTLCDHAPRE